MVARLTPDQKAVFKSRQGQQLDIFEFLLHLQSKAAIR